MTKYPARSHALSVKKHLQTKVSDLSSTAIFLSGAIQEYYSYSDSAKRFRQERYFYYLTGCNQPGSHVYFDLSKEELVLFLPEIDYDNVMWSGFPISLDEAHEKYDVDKVLYANEVESYLKEHETNLSTKLSDTNKFINLVKQEDKDLLYALDEARLIKDDYEIALMRKAAEITDNSHLAVMSALPIESNETHMHAEFVYHSIRQGSKFQSYDPICCSGGNGSTLHYLKNNDTMEGKESVLIDAGAEWSNYCSDVTRSFPISGIWGKEHREIYDLVLDMQTQTMKKIKPGASWDDIHLLAHRILVETFLKLGIFANGTADEIYESNVSTIFFPHGLGHLLGMDTHDVGGYPNYDDPDPKLAYLRLRRNLQKGMVVTNEPGCYFSPYLIELGSKDENKKKYINEEVLERYISIGGVRIEDDILVTENGSENLTKITSDPDEISKIVLAGLAKDKSNFHNVC